MKRYTHLWQHPLHIYCYQFTVTQRKEGDKSRRYVLPTRRCGTDCLMYIKLCYVEHNTVSPAASGRQHIMTTFISLLPLSDQHICSVKAPKISMSDKLKMISIDFRLFCVLFVPSPRAQGDLNFHDQPMRVLICINRPSTGFEEV